MTKKQLSDYKAANQRRKALMLKRNKRPVGVWVFTIQNGSQSKPSA